MKAILLTFLSIFVFIFTEQTAAQRDVCPPWFALDEKSSTGCSCSNEVGVIECGSDFPLLHLGFCMTYNSSSGTTECGPCPYVGHYFNITAIEVIFCLQLPSNVSLVNEFMCGPLNREGPLCGRCKDGYGTALYSYTMECSKCWEHGYGWVLYFFLELFPITLLYILVVIFHIRAASSPLSALVFMSQIVVYTIRLNVPLHMYIENKVNGFPYVALKVLLVLCGIWSLDFFRFVIPPFCASTNIKAVHALTLEYLVAFYPIFLISITYIFIKLHDNNFRPVIWLWKPFHRYFAHFRRRWDSKASIINAFTTFLLLSFSKILFVSFTLLFSFGTYQNYGDTKCLLYYDPTVECHTLEYSMFAGLASCVMIIFVLFPTIILILYPTRLFRKCVSCCGFRRVHALHMFVESFQGQYKDGTNGTRDFRMVSASFLILRILILVLFANRNCFTGSSLGQTALLASVTCFYVTTMPYKLNFMTTVDVLILFLLELLSLATCDSAISNPATALFNVLLIPISLSYIPHMVLIFNIISMLATKAGIAQYLQIKCKNLRRYVQAIRSTGQTEADVETGCDTGSLPDQLINPREYEPLLPTTEGHTAAELTEDRELDSEDPRRLTPVYTYGSSN